MGIASDAEPLAPSHEAGHTRIRIRMMRRVDWRAIAIVSAFVLPVCFFIPLQIFLNNITEFSVNFAQLFLLFLLVSSGLIGVLYLAASRLSSQIFLAAVTFLSAAAFIESRVFFGLAEHQPFDGNLIDWEPLSALSYIELSAILALAVLFAVFRHRQELFYSISLFILLFHSIGFLHATITRLDVIQQSVGNDEGGSTYFSDYFRLSRERNVIHIVPDAAQGALVHEILTSDLDRYSEIFDGFTLFTHAAGRYPNTFPSVSFYMTGRAPDPDRDWVPSQPYTREYIRTTLSEHSIVNTLAENNFKTFGFQHGSDLFYCGGMYTACTGGSIFGGLPVMSSRIASIAQAALELLDVALFRVAPLAIRPHIYNNEQWFLRRLANKTPTYSGVLDLFIEKVTTDNRPGSYNYIHHPGGHPPIQFDENCNYVGTRKPNYENALAPVTCFLSQLERLIQKLHQLGVYDETLILVHGDHGYPWLPPSLPFLSQRGTYRSEYLRAVANPAMLVKPLRTRGALQFSAAPVSIGDIPATINDAFELNGEFPGIPIFRLDERAERERMFFSYDMLASVSVLQLLPNMQRYRIRGDLFNQSNWVLPDLSDVGESPSALPMDLEDFRGFAIGFSKLENNSPPARWVVGNFARVHLSFPTEGRAQLVFDTYLPPTIPGQSMEVSVNNLIVAELGEQDLAESKKHVILLPDDLPRRKVNTIEFTMGKTVRIGADTRELSIVFNYVGLEPLE